MADDTPYRDWIANVAYPKFQQATVSVGEPLEVSFRSRPGEIIEDQHAAAGRKEPAGQISPDKTGAACDQYRTVRKPRTHSIRPLIASSARDSGTRSCACC